ncbi:DUF1684 domain-containing protein [Aureisphaera galaxeae]|uniref:DUF1684 domain-containing protein n=1 Tax=Aureisphaera galaxeae TaxID=1538023 RepID=UPI0023504266|nr:DUF1684 domain-containing protein [Aureisphaera galaxeae]MDC8006219.1 DUF1684 domain-containing protein [Aureisphaera galaxeae]
MKRIVCILLAVFSMSLVLAQSDSEIIKGIEAYQEEENEKFGDPETTILEPKDLKEFKELDFYPINLAFRIEAQFVRTPDEKPFLMPTTTDRLPEYVKYGELHFSLQGKDLKLNLYQSTDHETSEGYEDYLFLPFTDLTSGDGSYGGGRFLDARIPEGDRMIIDFNKAYNPYCAYSKNYSCPIPPRENDLLVRIEAGVKDFGDH